MSKSKQSRYYTVYKEIFISPLYIKILLSSMHVKANLIPSRINSPKPNNSSFTCVFCDLSIRYRIWNSNHTQSNIYGVNQTSNRNSLVFTEKERNKESNKQTKKHLLYASINLCICPKKDLYLYCNKKNQNNNK